MPLAATPVALALPPLWGALALAALLAVWLLLRQARREAAAAAPLVAVAALALLLAGVASTLGPPEPQAWVRDTAPRYAELWRDIAGHAADGVGAVGKPPADDAGRLAVHQRFAELLAAAHPDLTLLLVDPDGQPLVWEGHGLLHEPAPQEMPRRGYAYRAGFGSASLLAVAPLSDAARPWRVVAGRSFDTASLPFEPPGRLPPEAFRWSLVDRPEQAAAGAWLLPAAQAPSMVVEPVAGVPPVGVRWAPAVAGTALALGLLALAAMRAVGLAVLWRTALPATHGRRSIVVLSVAAALAAGAAAGAPRWTLLALLAGLAIAAVGWRWGTRPRSAAIAALAGAIGVAALVAAAVALQRAMGIQPLADARGGAAAAVLRAALLAAAAGALVLAAGEAPAPAAAAASGSTAPASTLPPNDSARRARLASARQRVAKAVGWLVPPTPAGVAGLAAVLLLGLAAALHDHAVVALPLLVAGGGAAALWTSRCAWRRRPAALVPLILLAALLGAAAWQTAYRFELARALGTRLLPAMAAPEQRELADTWRRLEGHLAAIDLAKQVPRSPESLLPTDLAYLLWRRSPLDRGNALTALIVTPHLLRPVSFSYGLPLTETGEIDRDPVRWGPLGPASWQDLLVSAEVPLRSQGQVWGKVRFWLLPQPGFGLRTTRGEDLPVGLLRGGPTERGPTGLPREVRYALYDQNGNAELSPWRETPSLPAALHRSAGSGIARVPTPEGDAWAVARRDARGTAVLFLPVLGFSDALEAVGGLALSMLLLVVAAAALVALLALTRASFRDALRRAVHSYSKRLLLLYGVLLLVPLAALNVLLLKNLEERLQAEQRAGGEKEVRSAQQVLGEYVASLEPGFGIETALDDELLVWLSRVLHHEVNLYWGSTINASSKRELFSAALLPERIPGDIYAQLALLGHDLAWRTSSAGGTRYLELYAPLRIPGAGEGAPRLFLSLPLLAQQQELQGELLELRRRAMLLTAAIFLVAAAVGGRLAGTFTRPIQQLVEGTRRIAGGATSLELALSEQELAALAAAIDEMARKIAEGRQRLVREKQVVERMVENVNSAVVSLDERGRVLLANRLAGELLGVGVGDPLRAALQVREDLAPVAAFLARSAGEPGEAQPAETTVHLPRDGDEREVRLAWVPVPGAGEPSALFVLEDVTEVLRSQRLQAWAEMARIIAHEIKNPLTPIRLSTEHMVEVHQRDPDHFTGVFERCTRNILRQVDELQQIAQEFSVYSKIPRLDAQPGDLAATVAEVVETYGSAARTGVAVRFAGDGGPLPARFDARLLRRALRNLLENALRASAGRGDVEVRLERRDDAAAITVADRGPGVPAELLQRIFDPYFSTHDTGTGLGLPITRRIVEEHGGTIAAKNRTDGGLEVVIMIPVE
ncbi:MAG TPA: ATP-binding protein [Thermoanaerobaculia bacterium]|nr:ATP-binding protein [Thermoanaerobaculia bacterium]